MAGLKESVFNDKLKLVIAGIGNDFTNELVDACPVDTGALKGSIDYSTDANKITIGMYHYGYIVDAKGNAKNVPNPWITRTLNTKLPNIIKENIKRQFK